MKSNQGNPSRTRCRLYRTFTNRRAMAGVQWAKIMNAWKSGATALFKQVVAKFFLGYHGIFWVKIAELCTITYSEVFFLIWKSYLSSKSMLWYTPLWQKCQNQRMKISKVFNWCFCGYVGPLPIQNQFYIHFPCHTASKLTFFREKKIPLMSQYYPLKGAVAPNLPHMTCLPN